MRKLSTISLWAVALTFSWAVLSSVIAGPARAASEVTGTWTGDLMIGNTSRKFTLQLHERAAGEVMGYIAGGTSFRTVTGGQVTGDNLSLVMELADPKFTRAVTISAAIASSTLTGTADDGNGPYPIVWNRVNKALDERRFLFAIPSSGDPTGVTELSVVLGNAGTFVSGGFVGQDDCDLFACGGGVTSFDDAGGVIQIGLEAGGACAMTGMLTAAFDSTTKFYDGTYTVDYCGAVTSGPLIGGRTTRTRTDHVTKVLATYGQLADDLEAEIAFSTPYTPFHPDYLHQGYTLADRLAELNSQVANFDAIEVEFSRFRNIVTVVEPDIFPGFSQPLRPEFSQTFGADFHDRRVGDGAVAGGIEFRNADTQSGADEFKYLVRRGNRWVIHGNRIIHDIPFANYTIAEDHVVLPTAGGDIYMSIGPWGAHVGPHTGHIEGNAKADWSGQYAWTLDQLVELSGDTDGICGAGETCGLSGADIDARRVDYIVTMDSMEILRVELITIHPLGRYYGSPEQWIVWGRAGDYRYFFDHIGEISQDLRDRMVAAGYADPWTVHDVSANLITGDSVTMNKGDMLARPQVVAVPVNGHPGYFTGKWGTPETPSQQIEFKTANFATWRQDSFYTWLRPELEAQLAGVLEASGLNPLAFRYNQIFLDESRWKAEMVLSTVDSIDHNDYSSLFSALGGWEKILGDDCPDPVFCTRKFAIYPIHKRTVFYDPGLYYRPDASFLTTAYQDSNELFGEVISPIVPDPVSGGMVIRWEQFHGLFHGFQGVSYLLNPETKILKISRGPFESTELAAIPPLVPLDSDVCDGVTVACYRH